MTTCPRCKKDVKPNSDCAENDPLCPIPVLEFALGEMFDPATLAIIDRIASQYRPPNFVRGESGVSTHSVALGTVATIIQLLMAEGYVIVKKPEVNVELDNALVRELKDIPGGGGTIWGKNDAARRAVALIRRVVKEEITAVITIGN